MIWIIKNYRSILL